MSITLKIGGVEYPMSGAVCSRVEEPNYGPDVRAHLTGKADFSASFTLKDFDADAVRVVFERRGLPRPGQWSDRARKRRARRLARAAERRFGLSRRGLRWGFPYEPPRALSAIHAECRAAMVEADRPMVEAAYQQLMPEGVTLTFPGPGMAVQDGLILGINIAPTLDQDIQDAIPGKGGGHV